MKTLRVILLLLGFALSPAKGADVRMFNTLADLAAWVPSTLSSNFSVRAFDSSRPFASARPGHHDPTSSATTNLGCVFATATGVGRNLMDDCNGRFWDIRWFGWTGTNATWDAAAVASAKTAAAAQSASLIYPVAQPTASDKVAVFLGDSVVEGASATTAANTWWRKVADRYGWSSINLAYGGAVASDLAYQSFPGYSHLNSFDGQTYTSPSGTATNYHVFVKVGINDGADFPTTHPQHAAYLTHFEKSLTGIAAYWATPDKTLAASMTQAGTWAAYTNGPTSGFGGSMGLESTTPGDSLTFSTMGDAVYVAYPVCVTNHTALGKLLVVVDGTLIDTVDPNAVGFGNREQYYGTDVSYIPFTVTNGVWCSRYSGLGSRQHTVSLVATNNSASLPSVVLWGAGSQQASGLLSGPNVWLMENLNRAPDATRDATYAALRGKVQNVADVLAGDGLRVDLIRPNAYYDLATGLSGDAIHPNDTGMEQIASGVLEAIERTGGVATRAVGSGGLDFQNGLTKTGNTAKLGGTLMADTTITAGSYDMIVNGTVKATATGSDFAVWARTDGSFPVMVDAVQTPIVMMRKVNTSLDSPTAVVAGNRIGRLSWTPNGGGGLYQNSAWIDAFSSETHSSGVAGSYMQFAVTTNGSATGVVVMDLKPNMATITTPTTLFPQVDGDDFSLWIKSTNSFPLVVDSLGAPQLYLRKLRGTFASPTAVQSGDTIGLLVFNASGGGSVYQNSAYIRSRASENHSSGVAGGYLDFAVTPAGTNAQVISLQLLENNAAFATPVTITSSGVGATINAVGTGIALNGDNAFGIIANRNSDTGPKEFAIQRSRAGATAVQAGDTIGILGFFGHNGTTYPGRNAGVIVGASETHTTTNSGTSITLSATPPGSNAPINSAVFRGINNDLYRQTRVADTGIDGNPDASAALEVFSTGRGFLLPRLTVGQRDGIVAPAEGLMIYCTSSNRTQYWNGSVWYQP